jgi:hypothetical protein
VFETRKEGELILIFAKKKKKLSKNVKIGSVLCPPKTTKKEYFGEHFRRLRV